MKFQLGKKRALFKGNFIRLNGTEFFDKGGKPQFWEWIDKADVISVLPIKSDGKFVLVKNYRVPVEKYVIEPPAGLDDKEGEVKEEIARRELLEETGYGAGRLMALPPWPYRSGTCKNMIYGFIALDLKKIRYADGDDTEDLDVLEISRDELMDAYFNPPPDTLIIPEILAMHDMAHFLKLIP